MEDSKNDLDKTSASAALVSSFGSIPLTRIAGCLSWDEMLILKHYDIGIFEPHDVKIESFVIAMCFRN